MFINGDKQAFEDVFHEYYSHLCRFAMRYMHDEDESEEVVQDTFVRLWQKRENITVRQSLKSYLYQSVRNSCLNRLKHAEVVREYSHSIHFSEHEDTDTLVTSELGQQIQDAMEKLPAERRRVFLMSRDEGLKYSEIAEQLGISVKTVENQIGRALKFLREELTDFLVIVLVLEIIILSGWG